MLDIEFNLEAIQSVLSDSTVEGDATVTVKNLASLSEAKSGDISFLGNPKYTSQVPGCKASVILVPKDYEGTPSDRQAFLRVENPSLALAQLCEIVEQHLWPQPQPGIHPSAVVDPSAQVSEGAYVGPLCCIGAGAFIASGVILEAQVHIGRNVRIGEKTRLMPQVTIYDYCEVGKSTLIASGTVVGSPGFGFELGAAHTKVPQIGNVVIGNNVDIGSNVSIDRARFSATVIEDGVKIDNLVQIAHNVRIGAHSVIVSQVGISGSTVLEEQVVLGGQTGLTGHIRIGKGSMVGAQSGINNDLEPGSFVRGSPAYPYRQAHKLEIYKKRLPELFKRVKDLEDQLEN